MLVPVVFVALVVIVAVAVAVVVVVVVVLAVAFFAVAPVGRLYSHVFVPTRAGLI